MSESIQPAAPELPSAPAQPVAPPQVVAAPQVPKYLYEAKTVGGFVQQLAVNYIINGYFFYLTGRISKGDSIPRQQEKIKTLDERLLDKYAVAMTRSARSRRKSTGLGNVHYLRFERFFVLIAHEGPHLFYEEEKDNIKDIRVHPINAFGYSIGFTNGHADVRINDKTYHDLRSNLMRDAQFIRKAHVLEDKIRNLPFERYQPVTYQISRLLIDINRKRKKLHFPALSPKCFGNKRLVYKPFEEPDKHLKKRLARRIILKDLLPGDAIPTA